MAWDESPAVDAYGMVTPIITGPFRIVLNAAQGMSTYQVEVVG